MPRAGEIQRFRCRGSGNIQVPIRPGYRFALSYLRCHFRRITGTGTDTATMTVDLDAQEGDDFDVRLLSTSAAVGVGADVHIRITEESDEQWVFENNDGLTVNWTNPETTGEIHWGLEVGIVPWQ